MALITYPKHPRAIVSKRTEVGKRAVAAACRRQLDPDPVRRLTSYGLQNAMPQVVGLREVWQMTFGENTSLWYLHGYASDLSRWEVGIYQRRPSSRSLKMSEQRFIEYVDQIHTVFVHWAGLVAAAKARGEMGTKQHGDLNELFDTFPAELIQELNDTDAGIEGLKLSQGGPEQNKRPVETRPEIKPLFDDELGRELALACEKQRQQPIADGRTVQDCFYFPLADVIDRVKGIGMSIYILDRIRWLIGVKERRPQWGMTSKPEVMREHDDFAARLVGHWLALHEALSPDGEIDVTGVESLLFTERILLTDVESLSSRDDLVVIHEARQAYQTAMKSARGRLSGLAERATLKVA